MSKLASVILICGTFLLSTTLADVGFGSYSSSVKTEWMDDGIRMRLLDDLIFTDSNGIEWISPAGSVVDGASIPVWAWSFVGSRYTGRFRDASVIHDIACQIKSRHWELVHLVFYHAMRASDVGTIKAKIMYAAVFHFGPRWSTDTDNSSTVPPLSDLTLDQFDELVDQIELSAYSAAESMTLKEIRDF